jgi:hypothetical protein
VENLNFGDLCTLFLAIVSLLIFGAALGCLISRNPTWRRFASWVERLP